MIFAENSATSQRRQESRSIIDRIICFITRNCYYYRTEAKNDYYGTEAKNELFGFNVDVTLVDEPCYNEDTCLGESYERFVRKRTLVKYQSQSEVI